MKDYLGSRMRMKENMVKKTNPIPTKEDIMKREQPLQEWQLCPKCNGEGRWNEIIDLVLQYIDCDLCNGKKIISKVTGEPPV